LKIWLPVRVSTASGTAVEVTSAVPLAVDTRTGNQIFKQNDYHGAPTNTTSQILQQSIVGAARAPTGEVHIRGQHAEYTYYVDGVPVPAGISGSLNELFDPEVVNQIDFQTGGWDAEYGNKNAAIVNVNTRIPTGGFHLDASGYAAPFTANQQDVNGFVNLGWRHRFDPGIAAEAGRTSELFAGAFFRDGSLNYTSGLSDDPTFVFFPDTTHYILSEDRNFHTAGLKLDYTL